MTQAKINLVTANEMILSESNIRQKSVKIFRALGVGTSHEPAL